MGPKARGLAGGSKAQEVTWHGWNTAEAYSQLQNRFRRRYLDATA
jgi:hypothetical protein